MKRIRECREATAGNTRDDIDFVDQSATMTLDNYFGTPEFFQNTEGESRCPRATTREGEDEECLRVVVRTFGYQQMRTITTIWIDLGDTFVDRPAGTAHYRQGGKKPDRYTNRAHDALLPGSIPR